MQAASKKTGSVCYFEPLRVELNDCFGALKDVSPDQVYSNRKGMDEATNSTHDEPTNVNQASTSKANDGQQEHTKKKTRKSNYNFYLLTISLS